MKRIDVDDRVRLVKLGPFDGGFVRLHDTGTVVKVDSFGIQVKWDNPVRTDCDGKWWINRDHCEVIGRTVVAPADELLKRTDEYLATIMGSLTVRDLLTDCRTEIERLRKENARLKHLVHKLMDEPND